MTASIRTIPFGRPWVVDADRKAVMEVLNGYILTHGPNCKAFEAEFQAFMGGDVYCVTVSSCMAALHLAYLQLGIGAGDEVIVPAQTHVATVHAVEWVKATPIFADCDPRTGNVTADAIARLMSAKTRAVALVHYGGIPCDMTDIMKVTSRHGISVIEDCAISLGARYQGIHVGVLGDVGCFSFYPVKHLTTGEGGMFVTKHRRFAEEVAKLRGFGVDRTYGERAIPGMYDVPTLGLNYRMSELQAALGRSQLLRMGENISMRRRNFEDLKRRLLTMPGLHIIDATAVDTASSYYSMTVVLEGKLAQHRNSIVGRLNAAGVGTSIYYPQPVPRMAYYQKKYGYDPDRYRQAARISDDSFALPVAPHVSGDDVAYMAATVETTLREVGV